LQLSDPENNKGASLMNKLGVSGDRGRTETSVFIGFQVVVEKHHGVGLCWGRK